jgi:hypothetical protein
MDDQTKAAQQAKTKIVPIYFNQNIEAPEGYFLKSYDVFNNFVAMDQPIGMALCVEDKFKDYDQAQEEAANAPKKPKKKK